MVLIVQKIINSLVKAKNTLKYLKIFSKTTKQILHTQKKWKKVLYKKICDKLQLFFTMNNFRLEPFIDAFRSFVGKYLCCRWDKLQTRVDYMEVTMDFCCFRFCVFSACLVGLMGNQQIRRQNFLLLRPILTFPAATCVICYQWRG